MSMQTDLAGIVEDLVEKVRNRYFGKYRGVVEDNNDTTGRGRLQVSVPGVLGTLKLWAMPCVPYAGNKVGLYSLPEPQTGVWVEFEGGDPSYPIWTGFFWGDNELPDQNAAGIKIWKTGKHTLRLDDDADEIKVENSSQCSLTMAQDIQSVCQQAKHQVGSQGVASEMSPSKLEVTAASVNVNSGALEVK